MDDLDYYSKYEEANVEPTSEEYWMALLFPALYWMKWA